MIILSWNMIYSILTKGPDQFFGYMYEYLVPYYIMCYRYLINLNIKAYPFSITEAIIIERL
jgi:hypothetical protein